MARSPFVSDDVEFDGVKGRRVRSAPPNLSRWWLGRAGGLIQLPAPDLGFDATPSQGETAHVSLGGGTTTTRRAGGVKYRWTLKWGRLGGSDWDLVNGFYLRHFGPAPWCVLPPESTNYLDEATSMSGGPAGDVRGWGPSSGVLASDRSIPSPMQPAGVVRWSGAGDTDKLVIGPVAGGPTTPDPTSTMPYVAAEPLTTAMWAWTATGTASVGLRLSGRLPDGTLAGVLERVVTLTTVPQRISVTADRGDLAGAVYVLPILYNHTASAPDILCAAPSLRCWDSPGIWSPGSGAPRVTMSSLTRTVDGQFMSNVSAVLAQT